MLLADLQPELHLRARRECDGLLVVGRGVRRDGVRRRWNVTAVGVLVDGAVPRELSATVRDLVEELTRSYEQPRRVRIDGAHILGTEVGGQIRLSGVLGERESD